MMQNILSINRCFELHTQCLGTNSECLNGSLYLQQCSCLSSASNLTILVAMHSPSLRLWSSHQKCCIRTLAVNHQIDLHGLAATYIAFVHSAVDTACSSSLVAIQLATAAILPGAASAALAGGVNLMLAPETTSIAQKAGMLSADGRCKTLDSAADGYGRGEACGLLLLASAHERVPTHVGTQNTGLATIGNEVSEQLVGRPTRSGWVGLIVGSAVGQDGRSSSLTAPNGPAQQAVIRSALQLSTCSPTDIGHVQMHGTGTSLGDPIEVGALSAVFTGSPSQSSISLGAEVHSHTGGKSSGYPLSLMAPKSWVGHSEPASGITSVAHAMASLWQAQALTMIHLRSLNPYVASPLAVHGDRRMAIARQQGPGLVQSVGNGPAGVSSFAFQGTNAHLLMQSPSAATHHPMMSGFSSGNQHKLTWQRQRAWVAPKSHPLLTSAHASTSLPPQQVMMQCRVGGVARLAYLQDHMVAGKASCTWSSILHCSCSSRPSTLLLDSHMAYSNSPALSDADTLNSLQSQQLRF